MGKTLEHYTKAFPNIKHYNEPITLAEALNEMKDFANHVTEKLIDLNSHHHLSLMPGK